MISNIETFEPTLALLKAVLALLSNLFPLTDIVACPGTLNLKLTVLSFISKSKSSRIAPIVAIDKLFLGILIVTILIIFAYYIRKKRYELGSDLPQLPS